MMKVGEADGRPGDKNRLNQSTSADYGTVGYSSRSSQWAYHSFNFQNHSFYLGKDLQDQHDRSKIEMSVRRSVGPLGPITIDQQPRVVSLLIRL